MLGDGMAGLYLSGGMDRGWCLSRLTIYLTPLLDVTELPSGKGWMACLPGRVYNRGRMTGVDDARFNKKWISFSDNS